MANTFLKPEVIAATSLELLQRDIVLPAIVWNNAVSDWSGKKDDSVTLRVPARLDARSRALRATSDIVLDELTETGVDLTIDETLYSAVAVSDEQLTLDIISFAEQVLSPQTNAVAYAIEQKLADEMTGATYPADHQLTIDPAEDVFDTLIDARSILSKSYVPTGTRMVVVGADVESLILKNDHFNRYDAAGSPAQSAIQEATIGRLAGFDIVTSYAIPANEAYAFHRSAFVLSLQAPLVPAGVPYGASVASNGLALRHVRDYDPMKLTDRSVVSVFAGTNIVADGENGAFVRAVKLSMPGGGTEAASAQTMSASSSTSSKSSKSSS